MGKPLVSVVIPAYRCEATIAEAIDSALRQDVPLEVLVVADDPEDSLAPVMSRYADNRTVTFLRNDRNLGAAESRNRGVQMAQGEYIAFLDADDCWADGKLKKQLVALRESGDVLCCTARALMNDSGKLMGRVIAVKKRISYQRLLLGNSISCSSVLLRRDVALAFPMGHEDSHEDYITWLQILKQYRYATGVNEPLLIYRVSNSGKSGSKIKSARMTFRAYRYMGFSIPKTLICFCGYSLGGLIKYTFPQKQRKK